MSTKEPNKDTYHKEIDPKNTYHFNCIVLPNAMPVYSGPIGLEIILDSNLQRVTPASLNPGSWMSSVKYLTLAVENTVWFQTHSRGLEIVFASDSYRSLVFVVRINGEIPSWTFEPAITIGGREKFGVCRHIKIPALKGCVFGSE